MIIGRIDGKPVIGLPSYPLAAATVLRELVLPLIARYGLPIPRPEDELVGPDVRPEDVAGDEREDELPEHGRCREGVAGETVTSIFLI